MEKQLSCFIIIGYGKKTSYASGKLRTLDLDETYSLLIKPVFDALEIPCYRAIDKNLSGSIDKLMLKEIKNADIAVVDLSTLNANVMWELGVRHALKPHHTIMICEKEQMNSIPFDVNHFVIHQYTHSEEGIPFKEVERFRNQLTTIVKSILAKEPQTDSPVFTFLEDELKKQPDPPMMVYDNEEEYKDDPFAVVMDQAEKAKNNREFEKALELFGKAKKLAAEYMTLRDNLPLIISRQALCTYKLKKPNETEALYKAKAILEELNPAQTQDIEVLGLNGAIYKRLFDLTGDPNDLDRSIQFYERGFLLKHDYYNGINAAFMLYKKASLLEDDAEMKDDIKLKADYYRNSVLDILSGLEGHPDFNKNPDAIWILLTKAEAYRYKNNEAKMKEYEEKSKALAKETNNAFAMDSYEEQKKKIGEIFKNLN